MRWGIGQETKLAVSIALRKSAVKRLALFVVVPVDKNIRFGSPGKGHGEESGVIHKFARRPRRVSWPFSSSEKLRFIKIAAVKNPCRESLEYIGML